MYNPPSETNWVETGSFWCWFREAYDAGYEAAKSGKTLDDNPHERSGHERDETLSDEEGFWWYCGFSDYGRKE